MNATINNNNKDEGGRRWKWVYMSGKYQRREVKGAVTGIEDKEKLF